MTGFGLFASGISALRAQADAFAGISQDISNLTTQGYKATDTQFAELVHSGAGSIFDQFSGTKSGTRNLIDHQGAIQSTSRKLDVAIVGTGFLVTNTQQDLAGETQLTRSGSLDGRVVSTGGTDQVFLADQNGNFVLGWPSNGLGGFTTGTTVSSLQPIRIDSGAAGSAAAATTTATLAANLPAGVATGTNFDLSVGVFDNLGNTHTVLFDFTKNAAIDTWDVVATTADGTVTAGSPASMTFDAVGNIVSPTNLAVGITWTNPATAAASAVAVDFSRMTQFAGSFTPNIVASNGNTAGTLVEVEFNAAGEVVGTFSNGLIQSIAKLPVALVRSENQLTPEEGTKFLPNPNTGDIRLVEADQSDFAFFVPQSVEESTVDLAGEFSDMVVAQRAYSSAAQTIKVVDEMAQVATRLKA
ncbi:MAG: flagellar hook-basal body complex protein [Alphaproteobacteria bacterium]|nr:flagellar hook-basal body complex protein [Alphaproteobacteria bacterium]